MHGYHRLGTVALVGAILTYLVKCVVVGGETRWRLPSLLVSRPLYDPHSALVEMVASGFAAAATIWARHRIMLLSMPARAASTVGK